MSPTPDEKLCNIDQLVYIYLMEKCPKAAEIVKEELISVTFQDPTSGNSSIPPFTLQQVVEGFSAQSHSPQQQLVPEDNDISMEVVKSPSNEDPLLHLPSLALESIFGFLSCKDLLPLRLMGQEWNHVASAAIRKLGIPVVFSSRRDIELFVSMVTNRIQPVHPFSTFEFDIRKVGMFDELCVQFAEIVGEFVHSYIFHFDERSSDSKLLASLITKAPNLKTLTVITDAPCEDILSSCLILPKLETLSIIPTLERNRTIQINPFTIRQWLQKTPKLMKFHCGFLISINSNSSLPELFERDMRHLTKVSVHLGIVLGAEVQRLLQNLINCHGNIHQLRLSCSGRLSNDFSLLAEFINSLSPTLHKLTSSTRDLTHNMGSILLPNCDTLELDFVKLGREEDAYAHKRISPDQFKSLKTVKISRLLGNFKIFKGGQFEGVENLLIENSPDILSWDNDFHTIFPNLKFLSIEKTVTTTTMKEIVINHKNLTHLQLVNFEEFRRSGSQYFGVLTGGSIPEDDVIWDNKNNVVKFRSSFSRLTHLKTLRVGGTHMEGVVFALVYLTAICKMPRLDSLSLLYEDGHQEMIARMGKMILDQYNWHGKVSVERMKQRPH